MATIIGTNGPDSLEGTEFDDSIAGMGGNDTVLSGGGNDTLDGGDGNDLLSDLGGNNTLYGGAGDDAMGGSALADVLCGGDGNDLMGGGEVFSSWVDYALGGDSMFGEGGNDTLYYGDPTGHVSAFVDGGDGNDTVFVSDAWHSLILGGAGDDQLIINPNAYASTVNGSTLDGGAGNDTIRSNTDPDSSLLQDWTIDGGDANDSIVLGRVGTGVVVNAGDGNDTIGIFGGTALVSGGAGQDFLVVDSRVVAAWPWGNQSSPVVIDFVTGEGGDVIDLTAVMPVMDNQWGLYDGDPFASGFMRLQSVGSDTVLQLHFDNLYDPDPGWETVMTFAGLSPEQFTRANFTDAVDPRHDSTPVLATGTAGADSLSGWGGDDVLAGGDGNDRLYGGRGGNDQLRGEGGADTLMGGDGNDVLDGGSGADSMNGGLGDDTYVVDSVADVVTDAVAGNNTVRTVISYTLGSTIANGEAVGTTPIRLTGNTLDNRLQGGNGDSLLVGLSGNDTLQGGGGRDSLVGGSGNDAYVFARGAQLEIVDDNDTTVGNQDIIEFADDIRREDLVVVRLDNHLRIGINGTDDNLIIKDWFAGAQHHVEQFRFASGQTYTDVQVDALINAMAYPSVATAGAISPVYPPTEPAPGVFAVNSR